MKLIKLEEIINMPDLYFSKLLQEKYGINRGVYNTIEQWFFEKGFKSILRRREIIVNFVIFLISHYEIKKNGQPKINRGGLSNKLNEFWELEIR